MQTYRIYLLGPNARMRIGPTFEAADDVEAIARAPELGGSGQASELWLGGRLVGRFAENGGFTPDGEP